DGAPAIRAPGREAMSFENLRALSQATLGVLNAAGIGRNDRIAIVLPNGPEMGCAFLAVAAGATAAPLNPAYKTDEFEFYLSDLGAKAVIVEDGAESPVIEAAARLEIPLIPLTPQTSAPAGAFSLAPPGAMAASAAGGIAAPDDTALILHTSGTTSRPKIVPLSQRNVSASAHNISGWLNLEARDCCLNVMPLFHIHGLIAAVLSSLYAGAGVACTPGFNALQFFSWLDEIKPSWYTAVPTMHQTILARAGRNREILARNPLRLIRSSSSSLPAPVMSELEEVFGAPVIEAYGMTEAAHQMACNPLPPRERRPGCVGIAAGPEVAIMAPD
ncbi:MAG: AMP-binding protein, partial [Alphaproteobacteria bacterium]|nr:AMP-binding protein [Alphaproteobacteria bacterium]